MDLYFILSLFSHGYKARTSTLYHLLKGKRTTSVLLYGFIYDVLKFFNLSTRLEQNEFNQTIQLLLKKKYLEIVGNNEVKITEKGRKKVKSMTYPTAHIDNYRFGKTEKQMWRVLQFSVQVISNVSYTNKHYIPIERSLNYQNYFKTIIKKIPKEQVIFKMKSELEGIFLQLATQEANFLANQFSGYHIIGKTTSQLLENDASSFQKKLWTKNVLHHLFALIEAQEGAILRQIISPFFKQNVNQSMNETKTYLSQTDSLAILAKKRGLKITTIQDHLLELALTSPYPFERFIDSRQRQVLRQLPKPIEEWDYHEHKKKYPETDYFQFRLVQVLLLKKKREDDC